MSDQLWMLTCPVTILHGTADEAINFKYGMELNELISHSQLIPIQNGGHLLWEMDWGETIRQMTAKFEQLDKTDLW